MVLRLRGRKRKLESRIESAILRLSEFYPCNEREQELWKDLFEQETLGDFVIDLYLRIKKEHPRVKPAGRLKKLAAALEATLDKQASESYTSFRQGLKQQRAHHWDQRPKMNYHVEDIHCEERDWWPKIQRKTGITKERFETYIQEYLGYATEGVPADESEIQTLREEIRAAQLAQLHHSARDDKTTHHFLTGEPLRELVATDDHVQTWRTYKLNKN